MISGREIHHAMSGVAVLVFIGAVGFLAAHCLTGCASTPPPSPRAATYTLALEECTRTSTTCEQSIACENDARARFNRFPLRTGGCE